MSMKIEKYIIMQIEDNIFWVSVPKTWLFGLISYNVVKTDWWGDPIEFDSSDAALDYLMMRYDIMSQSQITFEDLRENDPR